MTESYFVKCEDCGRRLPGPARKCDVCGGRMTRDAEESYYTPGGVIRKSHYRKTVEKSNSEKRGRAVPGPKPQSGGIWQMKWPKQDIPVVKVIIASIALIIIGTVTFADLIYKTSNDYTYEDSYYMNGEQIEGDSDYIYSDKTIEGDGYTLHFIQIGHGLDNYVDGYLDVDVTGNKALKFDPSKSIAFLFDGEKAGTPGEINIYSDDTNEDEYFRSSGRSMVMTPGNEYSMIISYNDIPEWDEITLIHNFGGSLEDRDTSLDITVSTGY